MLEDIRKIKMKTETKFSIQNSKSKEFLQLSSQNLLELGKDHSHSSAWWYLDHTVGGETTKFRIYNKINQEFYLVSDAERATLKKSR